jgi:hypothetical protein
MTRVIVDSFHRRREKQLRYKLRREAKLRRQGLLIGGTSPLVLRLSIVRAIAKRLRWEKRYWSFLLAGERCMFTMMMGVCLSLR